MPEVPVPVTSTAAGIARVGLVVVSHSAQIATGTIELARQMAPDVAMEAAGGTDGDGLGTSFERVDRAVRGLRAAGGEGGVVVLCDLGSAVLVAETVLELLPEADRARTRVADAPIVEGSVAAAVAAQTGASLDGVVAAAQAAAGSLPPDAPAREVPSDRYARTTVLVNEDGLHARPAAEFVRLAATFPSKVIINGKDAKSLLGIMSLGLMKGASVEIVADPEAAAAVDALVDLIDAGFPKKESR